MRAFNPTHWREWHLLKTHEKGGRSPTFSGSMMCWCGGNLQTAEKPSLFPLSCCDTRQNAAQPKTHCRCVSRSGSVICALTKCHSVPTPARDSGRAIGRPWPPCSAGNSPGPSGPDQEGWVRVWHSRPEWLGHRVGPRVPGQCQDSTRLNTFSIKPTTVLALSRRWPSHGLLFGFMGSLFCHGLLLQ